jgi:hypothetical protein
MFSREEKKTDPLDQAIDDLLHQMSTYDGFTEEYVIMADQLTKLYAIKEKNKDRVSLDTLVTVGGNLASILLIVNYEQANVLTSKALGLLLRTK